MTSLSTPLSESPISTPIPWLFIASRESCTTLGISVCEREPDTNTFLARKLEPCVPAPRKDGLTLAQVLRTSETSRARASLKPAAIWSSLIREPRARSAMSMPQQPASLNEARERATPASPSPRSPRFPTVNRSAGSREKKLPMRPIGVPSGKRTEIPRCLSLSSSKDSLSPCSKRLLAFMVASGESVSRAACTSPFASLRAASRAILSAVARGDPQADPKKASTVSSGPSYTSLSSSLRHQP